MSAKYRNNHYVPEWYQKRFLPAGQVNRELYLLDLKPGKFEDPRGISHPKRAVRRLGFRHCFAEKDLYTTRFGLNESTAIEERFFGKIDNDGRQAVQYFDEFSHLSVDEAAFVNLMLYMSTQKLRTPKGLGWLGMKAQMSDRQNILRLMLEFQMLHCAIWTECVGSRLDRWSISPPNLSSSQSRRECHEQSTSPLI